MAAGKHKTIAATHAPAAATLEAHGRKNKKKKRTSAKARRDDADALTPSDALDFGALPAPDDGLAEAIAAVLEAPRVAANGGGGGGHHHLGGVAGADAAAAAQAELLATANELYQRMDAGGGGLRPDGAYWAALPAHIRNFVRTASLSPPLRTAGGNERAKAQAMYAIAQQMVQTGEQGEGQASSCQEADAGVASERDVSSAAAAGELVAGWQGDMSLPVDPSFFADAAFTAALEQQGEESGIIGVGVGVAEVTRCEGGDSATAEERTGSHSIVSAGGERLGEGKESPAGLAADERGRGRGRRKKSVGHGPISGGEAEDDRDIPTRDGKLVTSSVVSDLLPKAEAAAAAAAAATARTPSAPKTKSSQIDMPSQTRQPSSRAQGKQPMNYPPPPPSATTTTTTTTTSSTTTCTTAQQKNKTPSPTTRSSRAASKAPLQPHPYPHTHPHHHPSPPSSNTSQTQKHRPPSSQAPSSRNNVNLNSKIWSTSSTEERERIKEFWLGLGEEERRNLVKLEKEAVLKKMKEQQRHSCACAVCGRKRSVCQFHLDFFFIPLISDA
jgi:Salt tolerance down-regulator